MLPLAAKTSLTHKTQVILDNVCQAQIGAMKHPPAIETDFTGSFVKYGVPDLHNELNSILGNYNVKVNTTAVYIHQSPMVKIDDPRPFGRKMNTERCELGDILFVQSHRRNRWKTYWRAVFWQLKMDTGSLQPAADPQFWLYDLWPTFHVYRGSLNSDPRSFFNSSVCDQRGGRFALVSNNSWKICPPVSPLGPALPGVVDAGQYLIEMMYSVDPMQPGRNHLFGRRVFTRPEPASPLSWSQTVWDILNVTGAKEFNARKLFNHPQARLSLLNFELSPNTSSHTLASGPPVSSSPLHPEEEGGRGLYVVHIQTDASDASFEEERLKFG